MVTILFSTPSAAPSLLRSSSIDDTDIVFRCNSKYVFCLVVCVLPTTFQIRQIFTVCAKKIRHARLFWCETPMSGLKEGINTNRQLKIWPQTFRTIKRSFTNVFWPVYFIFSAFYIIHEYMKHPSFPNFMPPFEWHIVSNEGIPSIWHVLRAHLIHSLFQWCFVYKRVINVTHQICSVWYNKNLHLCP